MYVVFVCSLAARAQVSVIRIEKKRGREGERPGEQARGREGKGPPPPLSETLALFQLNVSRGGFI